MRTLIAKLCRLRRFRVVDAGMSTVEYAVCMLAAVAFAGVLLKVLTSPAVQTALGTIVGRALK